MANNKYKFEIELDGVKKVIQDLDETQKRIKKLAEQLRDLAPASNEYQKILIELAKQGKIFEEQSKAAGKFAKNTSKYVSQSVDDIIEDLKKEGIEYDNLREKAKKAADTVQDENEQTIKTLRQLKNQQADLSRTIEKQGIGTADFKKTERELERVNSEVRKIEESFKSTGSALFSFRDGARTVFKTLISRGVNELISGFQRLTRGVTNFAKDTVKAFAEFEKQIDRVGALTGASEKQLEALSKQAKNLGATTAFSASEAAQAQQFLAQAGFSVDEIYSALPGTLELAAAGQLELAAAADIASNVLSGLALPVEDIGRVNDVLAKTASNANTNVSQLGQAFKNVAPTIADAGEEFEVAAAALGVLGNAGIQGGKAGTDLRNIILSLQAPTGKAAKTLKRLGIQTQDANGNFIGLTNILDQFGKTTTTAEDIVTIFGKRAQGAFNILQKEGAEGIAAFSKELENAGGFAKRVGEEQLDNLAGDFTRVQSATEGLQIALGELASGSLREVVGGFADLLGALTNVITGQELTAQQTQTVEKTLKVLGQILAVVGAAYLTMTTRGQAFVASLKAQVGQIRQTQGAVNKLGVAFKGLGQIVAGLGIGLAITALIELVDNLRRSLKATTDITADFEQAQAKATLQVREEKKELNGLFDELKKTEDGTIGRKIAIQNLNENYGEYIGNLEDENGQLIDIEEAQRKANEQLEANIRLKATQVTREKFAQQLEEERIKLEQLEKQAGESSSAYDKFIEGATTATPLGFAQDVTERLGFDDTAQSLENFSNSVERTLGSTSAAVEQDTEITRKRVKELEELVIKSTKRINELRKTTGATNKEAAELEKREQEEANKEREKALATSRNQLVEQNELLKSEIALREKAIEDETKSREERIKLIRENAEATQKIIKKRYRLELMEANGNATKIKTAENNKQAAIIQSYQDTNDEIKDVLDERTNEEVELSKRVTKKLNESNKDTAINIDVEVDEEEVARAEADIDKLYKGGPDEDQPSLFERLFIGNTEKKAKILEEVSNTLADVQEVYGMASAAILDTITTISQNRIDSLSGQLDGIRDQISEERSELNNLESELANAEGERRENIIRQIDNQRKAVAKLEKAEIGKERAIAKEKRKQAVAEKANGIVQATIEGAIGLVAAQKEVFPLNIIKSVIVAATTAAQIATIASQPIPQFKSGGFTGKGGDSDPVGIVHANEYVVPANVVRNPRYSKNIKELEGARLRGYQTGGLVAAAGTTNTTNNIQNIENQIPQQQPQIVVSVQDIQDADQRVNSVRTLASL